MSAVVVRDVWFAYSSDPVLAGVSFHIAPREFVALVGPNGSGKSTLLRLVLGLAAPQRGSVELLGSDPRRLERRWRVGYVPQRASLARELPATVEEVVLAGRTARRPIGRIRRQDREELAHALEAVGLTEMARRRIGELSGGQQQRAMIARALVTEPEVLILDEPTAGVDAESQERFRAALVHLQQHHGVAILLVSHDLSAVAGDLDRVVVLRRGQVSFDGTPGELQAGGVSLGLHAHDLPVWLEADA